MRYNRNLRNESTNCIFTDAFQIGQSNYKQPYTQMAAALPQFSPSNQAQMLAPRKALSVLIESEGRSGGRRENYGNSGQGSGPQEQSQSGQPAAVSCFLLATRVVLLYPRQGPLNTVTSVGEQESSLTYSKEGKSMSLESDTSDLKLGVNHFPAV